MLKINTWKRGSQRAPHKPLMLLYVLGAWKKGQTTFHWKEVKTNLDPLLEQFGGSAKINSSYPFIRLQNDNIWHVENSILTKSGDMKVSDLNRLNSVGKFSSEFEAQLQSSNFFNELIEKLLNENFSETLHSDILQATDLSGTIGLIESKNKRDPKFRQSVLDAYNHQCAICGYQIRHRNTLIGVEAAHIQWHNSQGPDITSNGIALCTLHHKLLDYGAISFDDKLHLLIAPGVNGTNLESMLYQFQGRPIYTPYKEVDKPEMKFIQWQRREVFKGI